jgi:hypothetical protein
VDYFIVKLNEKFGLIDINDKVVIPIEYDRIENMNKSENLNDGIMFLCQKNKLNFIIDLCGFIYKF